MQREKVKRKIKIVNRKTKLKLANVRKMNQEVYRFTRLQTFSIHLIINVYWVYLIRKLFIWAWRDDAEVKSLCITLAPGI